MFKLFNLKPSKKPAATDGAEGSLYDHFVKSKDILAQFGVDEKSIAERTKECFPRTVFDMKYETVSYDE